MSKQKLLVVAIASALASGCGGGGGGSTAASGSSSSSAAAASYVLPSQLDVVSAGSSGTSRALSTRRAFTDSSSDYSKAQTNIHTWSEALDPINTVNTILCFTGQMKLNEKVDEGAYTALIDNASCDKGSGGGQDSQSSSTATSYLEATVKSVRDPATGYVNFSVWVPKMKNGPDGTTYLRVKGTIKEGASETNPFGTFGLQWQMTDPADATNVLGQGELKTVETLPGFIGFTLYDQSGDSHGTYLARASVVMNSDRTNGVALTAKEESGMGSGSGAYAIAFDADHVLLQKASTLDTLGYKSNDYTTGTSCLARNNYTEAVWRYGMYDKDTGAEVKLKGGFPITYGTGKHGYVGYYGLWTEDQADSGSVTSVQKQTFDGTQGATYTVTQAPGRLIKKEVQELPLTAVENKIAFNLFDGDAQNAGYQQWEVHYQNGDFYKTGGVTFGNNGPQVTPLSSPILVSLQNGQNALFMYSDQLGGSVQYKPNDDKITFFKESYVNGSESEFAGGTLNLVCVDRCTKGGLTASDMSTFDGPFAAAVTNLGQALHYSIAKTDMSLKDGSNQSVAFPTLTSQEQQSSPWGNGVQSGPMVTADIAQTLSSPFDIYDPAKVTTFYVWDMGPNDWNKSTLLKDDQNAVVTFDKPMQFIYTQVAANWRAGSLTPAADVEGQTFRLEYAGAGDLHGIPSESDGNGQRWYPKFNLADGTVLGDAGQYVIKALDVERQMNAVSAASCSSLTVNDPAAPVPSSVDVNMDIGDKPTVDGAPSYIAGEVAE